MIDIGYNPDSWTETIVLRVVGAQAVIEKPTLENRRRAEEDYESSDNSQVF